MPVIMDFNKHKIVISFTYKLDMKKSEYASSETYVIDVVDFVAPIMLNTYLYQDISIPV